MESCQCERLPPRQGCDETHNASLSSALAGAVTFDRDYASFSHVTWLVGGEASWPWLADLAAQLGQHNPLPHGGLLEPLLQ